MPTALFFFGGGLGWGGGWCCVVGIRRLRVLVSGRNKRHLNQSCHMILAQESSQLHSVGLFYLWLLFIGGKHIVWIIMILNFRVQSFSVKDLGGSGFVHFCPRGDWFNYSVLFYQTNVLIKFSVAMRRTLFSVVFFFFVLILLYHVLTLLHFLFINLLELQEINAAKNWPCKSGQIPNTLRFDPLTSQTSGLFVAKFLKLAIQ